MKYIKSYVSVVLGISADMLTFKCLENSWVKKAISRYFTSGASENFTFCSSWLSFLENALDLNLRHLYEKITALKPKYV